MLSFRADAGDSYGHGGAIIAAAIVSFVLTAAVVALRFYTRVKIVRVLGGEDWTILVSLIFSLGVSITAIAMSSLGFGQHYQTISAANLVAISKTSFALVVFYQLSLAFTKVSILVLYLRLLTYHYSRWAVYVMLCVVVIYNIWGFVSEMTICIPLSKLWSDPGYGTCHPISFTWAVIGLHIATDFLIFFLPIPVFFNVKMSLKKKITVVAVFTVGFIACIISIVRAVRIYQLSTAVMDYTYDLAEISYWNLAEVNSSIICACLMIFKPLISRFWPRWLGSSGASDGDSDGQPKTTRMPTLTRRQRSLSTEEIAMVDMA
ncbi:hypothetical protein BR93DRAFT_972734 [Coniochaeta sp. PMI_546]|nr:hypothetical protein BR93DRAFT_972734 [Coniochaeta sp. PMI_546]